MKEFDVSTLFESNTKYKLDLPYGIGIKSSYGFEDNTNVIDTDDDNTIVIDTFNNRILKIDFENNVENLYGYRGTFDMPNETVIKKSGVAIVSDSWHHSIKLILPDGKVSTLIGSGKQGDKDGYGTDAMLNVPTGIAVDEGGSIFISDTFNHKIKKISPDGYITTFSGTGDEGDVDGEYNMARFSYPQGLTIRDGILIVADTFNHKIKGIDRDGNAFTIAGTGQMGDEDGPGYIANFNNPSKLCVSNDGTIIVSDLKNNKIKGIGKDGNVFTIAGTGQIGNQDGPGNIATFYEPSGIAIRKNGTIVVSDTHNNSIREIRPRVLIKSAVEI